MAHADQHAGAIVDQGQRGLDEAEILDERLVDQALLLQKDHPGECAHENAGPEWNEHDEDQQATQRSTGVRHGIGNRVAEKAHRGASPSH